MTDCRTRFIALLSLTWVLAAVVCDGLVVAGAPILLRLDGRVVDVNGDPVADAELFCGTWSIAEKRAGALVEGRSGADGTFTLTTGEGTSLSGDVWIHSTRHALQRCRVGDFLMTDEDRSLKSVVLRAPRTTRYRLVGPDGRPRAGELIEPEKIVLARSTDSVPPRLREVLGGVTDADGVWQATFLDEASSMYVRVVSEEFGVQVQLHQALSVGPACELKLTRVGSILGRIKASEPGRFAGKTVKVVSRRHPEEELLIGGLPERSLDQFGKGEATAEIDKEGRFRIPAIIAGNVSISVTTPADAEWVTEVGRTYELKEGETREIEVVAVQKVPFQGTILLSDGSPAEGVKLKLTSGAHWPVVEAETDAQGKFWAWVCPGDVWLEGHLPGHRNVPVFDRCASISSVTRGVGSGPSIAVAETLRLPALTLVEGTVVDRAGRPIPHASLNIWQQPDVRHLLSSDDDGRFRIYRTEQATLNQFSVSINGRLKVTSQDYGDPLVVRVLE